MHNQELYLKNSGLLFAHKFERVVHGGRGDYVEFTYELSLFTISLGEIYTNFSSPFTKY